MDHLLEVTGLTKTFVTRRSLIGRATESLTAANDVSLHLDESETLGLVGESGSGKSTTGRLILRLLEPDAGQVRLAGQDITGMGRRELRRARQDMQIVYQDPYACLDPTKRVVDSVGEPLRVFHGTRGRELEVRVIELLEKVGLRQEHVARYPYEFSGGQRQRIAIARALALDPAFVVADEPVSALDVSTQSQVVNLMRDLQDELGIAYLFVSHDLSVVRHIGDRIAVMYLGRLVEVGTAEQVYERPMHPYTESLLAAIPVPNPRVQRARPRIVLTDDPPDPVNPPPGCPFQTRCPYAMDICREQVPPLLPMASGGTVACHLHTEALELGGASVRTISPEDVPRAHPPQALTPPRHHHPLG